MNKTYKLSALWMMCLILFSSLSFTACDHGDEEDTKQYKGGVNLNVFGPCPVARGGELRFLGSGMDKVTAVQITGAGEVTDIKVISNTEIRVTVPQSAQPGFVVLHTPSGEITTKTKLTFTEPISLDALNPQLIKPGAELTLTGEYLNLIEEVIFADNVVVKSEAFTSQKREEIKLIVPIEAQSGKIIISDGAEIPNWIYSAKELSIVLPSVTKPVDLTNKKPGDEIVIQGKDFDLIKQLLMPNGAEVKFKTTTSENGDKLSFALPDNISDGVIVAVPASGVKIAFANIGVSLPLGIVATPITELRGKDVITLKGINMELITDVTFPGVADAVKLNSQSATEVKVTMPAAAISGELRLNTNSGKSVNVSIATAKPKNISYTANSIPAGEVLTIKGANLDVVSSILFGGNLEVNVSATHPATLAVTVPTTAETGVLLLKMANGESVEAPSLTVEKPVCAYLPSLPGSFIGGRVVELEILNGNKLSSVLLNGAAVQYIHDAAKKALMVNIPSGLEGTYTLKLISTNGEISYKIAIVPNESTVWSGPLKITWGEGGRVLVPAAAFSGLSAGTTMKVFFDQIDQTWGQAQFNYGNFEGISFSMFNQVIVPTDVYGWTFASRILELTLTQEILDNIRTKKNDCEGQSNIGIVIQGGDLIFTKITVVN